MRSADILAMHSLPDLVGMLSHADEFWRAMAQAHYYLGLALKESGDLQGSVSHLARVISPALDTTPIMLFRWHSACLPCHFCDVCPRCAQPQHSAADSDGL